MASDPLPDARVIGHGPLRIIAVHGWMGDHRLFDPLAAIVDQDRWSLCLPDCRGYGARRHVPGTMTVEEIALDMLALADALGWRQFHLLGHSMAGMAAQRLMIDASSRLASALLLAPVPAGGARIGAERRELLTAALSDPALRLRLIDINTGGQRDRDWLAALRDLSLSGTAPGPMARYMASWTGEGFSGALRGNRVPASVIIGALDPGTPEAPSRALWSDLLPEAPVEVLPGVGHYAMQEDPRALQLAMERHFARFAQV